MTTGLLKSRDITLPTKVRLVKAMVFPVVIYGCESWTVKKAERQRIDAFELWCWRRLLELFRMDWLDVLLVQGILKILLQQHSLKASVLQCSAFLMVKLSYSYVFTENTIALAIWIFVGKLMSLLFNML